MLSKSIISKAANSKNIVEFLNLIFPPEWDSIKARIIESGVVIHENDNCKWMPRLSPLPFTVKTWGATEFQNNVSSIMYRIHDCIHQLWGMPLPTKNITVSLSDYKKAQMCGEVVVLMLTEIYFGKYLWENGDDEMKEFLKLRDAVPMYYSCLKDKTMEEILLRFDGIFHHGHRPSWIYNNKNALEFVNYYDKMLQTDRENIDFNYNSIIDSMWELPEYAMSPVTYSNDLDGTELTLWMLRDFQQLKNSSPYVDTDLMEFNRKRRKDITLPTDWI